MLNVPKAFCSTFHLELSPLTMVNRERYPSVLGLIPPLDIHATEAFRALQRISNTALNVTLNAKTLSIKIYNGKENQMFLIKQDKDNLGKCTPVDVTQRPTSSLWQQPRFKSWRLA